MQMYPILFILSFVDSWGGKHGSENLIRSFPTYTCKVKDMFLTGFKKQIVTHEKLVNSN